MGQIVDFGMSLLLRPQTTYKKGDKGGVFDVPPIRQAWNGSLSWTKQSSLIYEIK